MSGLNANSSFKGYSITDVLNRYTRRVIRWCTPSVLQEVSKVIDPYSSDMSVSYHLMGFPFEPSGIFETAYKKAAKAYKSDKTLFSVNAGLLAVILLY